MKVHTKTTNRSVTADLSSDTIELGDTTSTSITVSSPVLTQENKRIYVTLTLQELELMTLAIKDRVQLLQSISRRDSTNKPSLV